MTSASDQQPRNEQPQIGLTGLAVMGRNLARNIARHGHPIAVHNRTPARMTSLVKEFADEGTFVGSESLPEFVASIRRPRAIIVMVKAGEGTDAVIDELVPLLEPATMAPGFPTRDEVRELYAERSGRDLAEIDFYVALGLWKLAIVLEGVFARFAAGQYGRDDADEGVKQFANTVERLVEAADRAEARL